MVSQELPWVDSREEVETEIACMIGARQEKYRSLTALSDVCLFEHLGTWAVKSEGTCSNFVKISAFWIGTSEISIAAKPKQ